MVKSDARWCPSELLSNSHYGFLYIVSLKKEEQVVINCFLSGLLAKLTSDHLMLACHDHSISYCTQWSLSSNTIQYVRGAKCCSK